MSIELKQSRRQQNNGDWNHRHQHPKHMKNGFEGGHYEF
jgi:hypothetical protein